jgi:GT2 family glycosyltransferase
MPKVSIIVPNYNHAAYLNERISSILAQTFTDFEIILMDDNSSDNSRQILETYRSIPNVQIIFNEVNSGSSFKQWNKGAQLCKGEYIWIAESDDIADKEFLSTLVPVLDNNPGVALVYAQSYEINSKGYITGTWFDHTKVLDSGRWISDFTMQGNKMIKKYMIHRNCIPNASGVLFRRDKMEAIGMADETFKLNGDWLFWIKLMENSTIAFVAKSLNYFRTHGNSVRNLTQYSGLSLYEYSWIIEYVSGQLNFNRQEKKDIVKEFYGKLKWAPTFHSWGMEPGAFKNVRKSYSNLIKQDKSGIFFFIKHVIRRFCLSYVRIYLYKYFKNSSVTSLLKKPSSL